ncbi:MAG TPA: peptidoglycan-associated lipoprotein Pal [Terriglobales bacterium]|nr:peptidoglycan-associated lipoprotein Pal [Terriglobales bacterium]
MKHSKMKWSILLLVMASIVVLGACKKKVAPPPPPPPPPPPAPTASLTANPNTIQPGQSTNLIWQTQNATNVSIDGIGTVEPSGNSQVTPTTSTTYHLIATGPGGSQDATARVTVTAPPPPPAPSRSATDEEMFNQNIKDIFFDYDSYDIRPDQQSAVQADAAFLKQHPNITFTVEGHCDERGSTEYNLALGDNRAGAVRSALVQAGVPADRIHTISYGKEKPFCTESNEQCWQQNRRGHFVYGSR